MVKGSDTKIVYKFISKSGGKTPSQIARALSMDSRVVMDALKRMEKKGKIKIQRDPATLMIPRIVQPMLPTKIRVRLKELAKVRALQEKARIVQKERISLLKYKLYSHYGVQNRRRGVDGRTNPLPRERGGLVSSSHPQQKSLIHLRVHF